MGEGYGCLSALEILWLAMGIMPLMGGGSGYEIFGIAVLAWCAFSGYFIYKDAPLLGFMTLLIGVGLPLLLYPESRFLGSCF